MAVYEGSEQYIFVSYAHKDSAIVIPIINALQSAGFRVWYDQGIQAGTEWPAYIEGHLNQCRCVLVCMSPATIESVNCRNEINYACMLQKDMLVVYLEPTELAKGMNLQLNSQQSLFRYRHTSDKTFLSEVIQANILMPCKEEKHGSDGDASFLSDVQIPDGRHADQETGDRTSIIAKRLNRRPVISRVGTMGSNTPDEAWPKGSYSQLISIKRFRALHFHCNLIRPNEKEGTKSVGLRIFDSHDNLVFEKDSSIKFSTGDDKFSIGWIIRDQDGLPQAPDLYTALIWVDDSRVFEYSFKLFDEEVATDRERDEVETLKKKLSYPPLFIVNFLCSIFGLLAIAGLDKETPAMCITFGLLWLIFVIITYKKTRKIVCKNRFLAILFITIGSYYYGIYLLIMTISSIVNRKKWTERIKEIQARCNFD